MGAFEQHGPDLGARLAQTAHVVVERRRRVELVARASADERGGNMRERGGVELRRDVAADGDDSVNPSRRRCRGAERHRHTLRKTGEHQMRGAWPLAADRLDHAGDICQIVRNRELAVLPRHPPGDHLVGAALIETVQPLD